MRECQRHFSEYILFASDQNMIKTPMSFKHAKLMPAWLADRLDDLLSLPVIFRICVHTSVVTIYRGLVFTALDNSSSGTGSTLFFYRTRMVSLRFVMFKLYRGSSFLLGFPLVQPSVGAHDLLVWTTVGV